MENRSPIVEVTPEQIKKFTDTQIGRRVRAAIAHSPVSGHGNYTAIVVAKNRDELDMTPEDVRETSYDIILNHKISPSDQWRALIGEKVRENFDSKDWFVLARS
jgi:hypothetical protein